MEETKEKQTEEHFYLKNYLIATAIQIALIFLFRAAKVTIAFKGMEGVAETESLKEILSGFSVLNIICLITPFVFFGRYFLLRGLKRYGSYRCATVGIIFSLILFAFTIVSMLLEIEDSGIEMVLKLNVYGHLYWILSVVQLISVFFLCSQVKNYKRLEERLTEQEIIKKKYDQENATKL